MLSRQIIKGAQPKSTPYEIRDHKLTGLLLRIQPSGHKSFYVEYGRGRRTSLGSIKSMNLAEARVKAKDIQSAADKGIDHNKEKARKKQEDIQRKNRTLGAFIENTYAPVRVVEKKRGDSDVAIIKRNFSQWYGKPLEEITPWLLRGWRKNRLKIVGAKTINRATGALKTARQHAVPELIQLNPLTELKPLKVNNRSRVRYLSEEEEVRFRKGLDEREKKIVEARVSGNKWRQQRGYEGLNTVGTEEEFADHVKPIVLLLINTGCRPQEILNLDWDAVDIENRRIKINAEFSKSGESRHIPLGREAYDVITHWRKQTTGDGRGLVFPSPVTGMVMEKVPRAITRVIRKAGIENFRPYDLRHSFASKMVQAGIPLYTLGKLLGHSKAETTMIYAHLSDDHLRDAVTKVFD